MRISDEVCNCLINQAIVMKHESNEDCDDIAFNVVEEYFRGDELSLEDKNELVSKIRSILGD
jgi:hypothetical protein